MQVEQRQAPRLALDLATEQQLGLRQVLLLEIFPSVAQEARPRGRRQAFVPKTGTQLVMLEGLREDSSAPMAR